MEGELVPAHEVDMNVILYHLLEDISEVHHSDISIQWFVKNADYRDIEAPDVRIGPRLVDQDDVWSSIFYRIPDNVLCSPVLFVVFGDVNRRD